MGNVLDRCDVALTASNLQLLRMRRAIEASGVQIASTTGLIHESRQVLARMRGHEDVHHERAPSHLASS